MIDQKEKQELEERLKYVIKDSQELNRKIDIIEDAIASISCNKTLSEECYTNMLASWALRNQLCLLENFLCCPDRAVALRAS
jgi:DNA mismatch repair ATPase MutL